MKIQVKLYQAHQNTTFENIQPFYNLPTRQQWKYKKTSTKQPLRFGTFDVEIEQEKEQVQQQEIKEYKDDFLQDYVLL